MNRISIRLSLVVTVVALGALGLSIAAISGRIYGDHVVENARDQVAQRLLRAIERTAAAASETNAHEPVAAADGFLALERALGLPVRVLRADGALVFQSSAWPEHAGSAHALVAEQTIARPPATSPWRVQAAENAELLHARIEQMQYGVFFAAAAVTLLVMLVAVTLLDRVALSPWRSLIEQLRAAERDENELGRAVAVGGNAEAVELAESFNRMSARLKSFYEHLERIAFTDPLTQLPNRSLLLERLERAAESARRENHRFALFVLDLDRFKEVNGAFGHRVGDALLKQAAGRIRAKLRDVDFLARAGGDEFAVLVPTETPKQAELAARMLLQCLRPSFLVEAHQLEVRASLGIALYPDHGVDADSLIRNAEIAMYGAKQAGAGHTFYDARLNRHQATELALKGELRRAIEEEPEQFVLYFQPKISLKNDRVAGLEALVRWRHPAGRLILPETFVPLLEQTGLLRRLIARITGETVRMARELRDAGFDLPLALNACGRDLQDSGLGEELAEHAAADPDLPQRLEVEIAEPVVMADAGGAAQVLRDVAGLGFRVIIDHFGTGYSSLAHLKKLPVQAVKIDRSFVAAMVRDESDAAIVSSSIELAHHLGLEVVAEGVDDGLVLSRLRSRGCDAVQGLYLSRPLPADEVIEWLAKSDWGLAPRTASRA